jgi:outer membrane protein OmpA-like peptidoglycan-associated protein
MQQLVTDLAKQIGPSSESRALVIDPLLDRATGQQTGTSQRVEEELRPALSTGMKGFTVLPFDRDGAERSRYVVTGTVVAVEPPGGYRVSVSLTDRQNGLVVAQSAVPFREAGLDSSPTAFYSDSPSLVRDRSVDGYIRTSETKAGSQADALFIEQLPTEAVLAEALNAYNNKRWDQALAAYTVAAGRPDGQQLRSFNGLYLSNVRLGRTSDAEAAFARIAALGLATNNLAMKLLFEPGSSTQFRQGPDLSGVYPMWLRQISRAVQTSGSCLNIVGHTSRSGSESLNLKLSVARAETVKRLLEGDSKGLADKRQLAASGVGFEQNIIGTGTDDARDAVDRRVEFKVVPCQR